MKVISVVGARPNFMKIAPFIRAINKYNQSLPIPPSPPLPITPSPYRPIAPSLPPSITHTLVHTGQHYDDKMSRSFFEALNIPDADINLEVGSGTHAEQIGNTMIKLEKVLEKEQPDWVIVVGDVNATLAASVTVKKLHIKVCHIEAGLRSGDMTMPEEINRLVTDRLADLLLTPDAMSGENLLKEGIDEKKIKFVGNIMIDTLEANREKASQLSIEQIIKVNQINGQTHSSLISHNSSLTPSPPRPLAPSPPRPLAPSPTRSIVQFALMTLHRPSNVDKKEVFEPIINFLTEEVARDMNLIWPIHPRAEKQLKSFGLWDKVIRNKNLILLHPIGYQEMLRLNMDATIMLTDSGGLQEECTVLGTPCLTLRWNTERPVTLREYGGASVLVGNDVERIRREYYATLKLDIKPGKPELWDGNTAGRCLSTILEYKDNNVGQER